MLAPLVVLDLARNSEADRPLLTGRREDGRIVGLLGLRHESACYGDWCHLAQMSSSKGYLC